MLNSAHLHVLRLISTGGPTTRAALGEHLGLSKAAISGLTRELLDGGYLIETDTVQKQGRPSRLLDLRPDGLWFLGVSMVSDPLVLSLVDFKGGIAKSVKINRSSDPAELAQMIAAALPDLAPPEGEIAGIGVALSGLVDSDQAVCIRSTQLGWRDVPLAALLAKATGLPVFIENDAKALALREKLFGAARDASGFTLIWLGAGIGAAHFVHDRLHRGAHGGAGEVAHVTVDPDGLPCRCGKTGCLDTVASLTALIDQAHADGLAISSLTEIEREAAAGKSAAIRMLHRAGGALGLAIAQIIQLYDPELVLVTHREDEIDGLLFRTMNQAIEANVLPSLSGVTPIRVQKIEDTEWAVAAASVANHSFLNGLL